MKQFGAITEHDVQCVNKIILPTSVCSPPLMNYSNSLSNVSPGVDCVETTLTVIKELIGHIGEYQFVWRGVVLSVHNNGCMFRSRQLELREEAGGGRIKK